MQTPCRQAFFPSLQRQEELRVLQVVLVRRVLLGPLVQQEFLVLEGFRVLAGFQVLLGPLVQLEFLVLEVFLVLVDFQVWAGFQVLLGPLVQQDFQALVAFQVLASPARQAQQELLGPLAEACPGEWQACRELQAQLQSLVSPALQVSPALRVSPALQVSPELLGSPVFRDNLALPG